MARYMTFRFDVTSLTERQREVLAGSVIAQSEASDFDYATNQEWADENYPSIKVAEVCHFCGQVVEDGECGGEGEGICTELACVSDFALPGKLSPTYSDDVEAYVRDYCAEHGIEDSLVPYRADGLTYYQQLAYMVREHHDLPQLKVSDHTLHAALPEHNGWYATYEYPGFINYTHPDGAFVVCAASDFNGDAKLDIQIHTADFGRSLDDGENEPWPHEGRTAEKMFARIRPYLDKYHPITAQKES